MSIRDERGFTLLEMLIALGLLAIIFSYLFGALNFGFRAWTLSNDINEKAPTHVIRQFLKQHIAEALPFRITRRNAAAQVSFQGKSERIEFVTRMPDRVVVGGLYRLSLFTRNKSLMLEIKSYHPLRSSNRLVQTRTLLDRIDGLEISYYGKASKSSAPQWHSQWQRNDILPDLIKVNLTGKNAERWVPLTVKLRLKHFTNFQYPASRLRHLLYYRSPENKYQNLHENLAAYIDKDSPRGLWEVRTFSGKGHSSSQQHQAF